MKQKTQRYVITIVISVLVMSFLVIIKSLIAFTILIIIEKYSLKASETRRYVDIILDWHRYKVIIGLSEYQ